MPSWPAPHVIVSCSGVVAVALFIISVGGQIGWNAQCQFETDDFVVQVRQTLQNIVAVLAEAGADVEGFDDGEGDGHEGEEPELTRRAAWTKANSSNQTNIR